MSSTDCLIIKCLMSSLVRQNVLLYRDLIFVVDVIFQFIRGFKANQKDLDTFLWCVYGLKFMDQVEHIMCDVDGIGGIDDYLAVFRQVVQRKFNSCLIQEGNFLGKINVDYIAVFILFLSEVVGSFDIAFEYSEDTDDHPQSHTLQKV